MINIDTEAIAAVLPSPLIAPCIWIVGLIVCLMLAVVIVNVLRFLQYYGYISNKLYPPDNLNRSEINYSDRKFDEIGSKLLGLTKAIAREGIEPGEREKWFINKINNPMYFIPPDIFSVDSFTSFKTISPAALMLWTAQINELNSKDWGPTNHSVEAYEGWRNTLSQYITASLNLANQSYETINSRIPNKHVPRRSVNFKEFPLPRTNRVMAARIIILDIDTLSSDATLSVIKFHAAVQIPLFFIDMSFLRGYLVDITSNEFLRAKHIMVQYLHFHNSNLDFSRKTPINAEEYNHVLPNEKAIWSSLNDDFIIVDDVAWQGYDFKDENGAEAFPFLLRFFYLLACKKILLASDAYDLANKRDGDDTNGGIEDLRRWYKGKPPIAEYH